MKKNSGSNLILSIALVLCLLLLGISATYAFFTRKIEGNGEKTNTKVISGVLSIDFKTNKYINSNNTHLIKDSEIFEKADKSEFSIKRNTNSTVDNVAYNLYLELINLPDEFKSKYVKWALYDSINPSNNHTPIANGNFENIGELKKIQLNQARIELSKTDIHNYTLFVWLSYSETELQNELLSKTLHIKVATEAFTY